MGKKTPNVSEPNGRRGYRCNNLACLTPSKFPKGEMQTMLLLCVETGETAANSMKASGSMQHFYTAITGISQQTIMKLGQAIHFTKSLLHAQWIGQIILINTVFRANDSGMCFSKYILP